MKTPETQSGGSLKPVGSATSNRNLAWAERKLMKLQDEETDPQLRALWSTAARIARERINRIKVMPNAGAEAPATDDVAQLKTLR